MCSYLCDRFHTAPRMQQLLTLGLYACPRFMAVGHTVADLTCFHRMRPSDKHMRGNGGLAHGDNRLMSLLKKHLRKGKPDHQPTNHTTNQHLTHFWKEPQLQHHRHRRHNSSESSDGVHQKQMPSAEGASVAGRRSLRGRHLELSAATDNPTLVLAKDIRSHSGANISAHPCDATHPAPTNESAWMLHFRDLNHTLPKHHWFW